MSYIELNGVSSNDISGLLISALPPVSLPAIRTTVETIDGRDGDIVTKLGYSAVDKKLTIGLYGDFDINEIIEYFASEGTVIFSDEPDKYYKYQILQQIDFARLLRFRTATVILHCQPFKYKVNETPIESTGSSATVTNSGNVYAKPTVTITGSGTVSLYIDTEQILSVNMGSSSNTIIINIDEMNAYDTNGNFKNRSVTGDYSSFILPVGQSTVSWSGGTVSAITIQKYSRWL